MSFIICHFDMLSTLLMLWWRILVLNYRNNHVWLNMSALFYGIFSHSWTEISSSYHRRGHKNLVTTVWALYFLGPFLALKLKNPRVFRFFRLVKSMKKAWEVILSLFHRSLNWKIYIKFSSFDSLKFDEDLLSFTPSPRTHNKMTQTSIEHSFITLFGLDRLN